MDPNEELNKKLLKAAKILERMVNQNTFNDIALGELTHIGLCKIQRSVTISGFGLL